MADSAIPDKTDEVLAPEPSSAVVALRKEVHLAQSAVYALGEMPIKAKEASHAADVLAYLDKLAAAKIAELDSLIATELLGAPMKVEGGTKLSMVEH